MNDRDHWVLISADGRYCGHGSGPPDRKVPGERIVWITERADLEENPVVAADRARRKAETTLSDDRQTDYALKTISARMVLQGAADGEAIEIDPDVHPELHDEHCRTCDKTGWSQRELVQRIVDKAAEASGADADRRRRRLDAREVLARPDVAIDPSEADERH